MENDPQAYEDSLTLAGKIEAISMILNAIARVAVELDDMPTVGRPEQVFLGRLDTHLAVMLKSPAIRATSAEPPELLAQRVHRLREVLQTSADYWRRTLR